MQFEDGFYFSIDVAACFDPWLADTPVHRRFREAGARVCQFLKLDGFHLHFDRAISHDRALAAAARAMNYIDDDKMRVGHGKFETLVFHSNDPISEPAISAAVTVKGRQLDIAVHARSFVEGHVREPYFAIEMAIPE